MDDEYIYPKGSLIFFTSGEFSDYGINGVMVTLKDCDLKALAKEMISTYVPENDWDDADYIYPDKFISWLVKNGYVEPSDYTEVHLANYELQEFIR